MSGLTLIGRDVQTMGLLGTADPSVTSASTAITTFISNNAAVIFALVLTLAALAWGLGYVNRKVKHIG